MEEEETKSEWEKLQSSSQKTNLKFLPPKQRVSVYGKIIVRLTQCHEGHVISDVHISVGLLIQTIFKSRHEPFVVLCCSSSNCLLQEDFHSIPGRVLNICPDNRHFLFLKIVKNSITRKKYEIVETGPVCLRLYLKQLRN